MGSNMIYTFMPPDNIYLGSRELMIGEEDPIHSTRIPPLPSKEYFTCKWDSEKEIWRYVESPMAPNVLTNPLNEVLTYADCRRRSYPKMEDYIDGIVKGDTDQMAVYIEECMKVKEDFPKTMEPITLREYFMRAM